MGLSHWSTLWPMDFTQVGEDILETKTRAWILPSSTLRLATTPIEHNQFLPVCFTYQQPTRCPNTILNTHSNVSIYSIFIMQLQFVQKFQCGNSENYTTLLHNEKK